MNDKGEPLAFASIRLNRNGIGTLTNEDGRFRLSWAEKSNSDSLIFSFMGYKEVRLSVQQFISGGAQLKMNLAPAELESITVTSITAIDLVKRAVGKIPDNYFQKQHVMHGFYRIHTRKGQEQLMLSEAVFDILNPGYTSSQSNSFRLTQMRSVQDEEGSHGIDLGMKPNEIYRYDIIRELSESKLLNKSGLNNHTFRFLKRTTLNGRPVHQVAFDQKDGLKESFYKGTLYIDVETDAIAAIRFGRSPKGISYARYGSGAERTLLKLMGMQIDINKDDLFIQYQSLGDRWVLSNVQNINEYRFRNKKRRYDFTADIRVDYVITGIDTNGAMSFSGKETLGNNKFIEYQERPFEKDFWKDHTILLADFNSDTIAATIQRKNENSRLKNQVLAKWKKLPEDPSARMDSIISLYMQKGMFNGTVLIKQKGKMVLQKGYGLADESSGKINQASTQFRIGSLSKTFTSTLILKLAAEGKCDLADSIGRYLPGYTNGRVTIAQLLSHSSGVPGYTRSAESLSQMVSRSYSLQELIDRFGSEPLEFEPGTSFRYSNTGYLLLAALIEKLENRSLKDVLQERIFAPLEMNSSVFGDATLNSKGYWMGAPEQAYPIENMAGAGGISSTVDDLAKWATAMTDGKFVSKEIVDTAFKPRFAYTDWDAWYGYGWMIDENAFLISKKQKVIYHPGTDLGYYSMFVMVPEIETVIILLSNHGDFPRYDMTDLIFRSMLVK